MFQLLIIGEITIQHHDLGNLEELKIESGTKKRKKNL